MHQEEQQQEDLGATRKVMKRVDNYRTRLFQVASDYEAQSFEYGTRDCCLFASDIVKAQLGIDLAKDFRGKYSSAMGGLKLLRKNGYNDQRDFVRKNFVMTAPNFAHFGDLVVLESDDLNDRFSLGFCAGSFALMMGQNGVMRIERSFGNMEYYRIDSYNEQKQ